MTGLTSRTADRSMTRGGKLMHEIQKVEDDRSRTGKPQHDTRSTIRCLYRRIRSSLQSQQGPEGTGLCMHICIHTYVCTLRTAHAVHLFHRA